MDRQSAQYYANRREDVCNLYSRGVPVSQIAQKWGCTTFNVYRIVDLARAHGEMVVRPIKVSDYHRRFSAHRRERAEMIRKAIRSKGAEFESDWTSKPITTNDAVRICDCARSTIYTAIRRGRLRASKHDGKYQMALGDLLDWCERVWIIN